MAISSLITSPQTVCYINSIPFARCSGLNYDISTPRREIRGIDTLEPLELLPTFASIHGTMHIYRLHQDGGIEAAGMIATFNKLTKEKYFSLTVIDRATDTILFNVNKCSVSNQSWSVVAKSFIVGTITWSGFDYENDAE